MTKLLPCPFCGGEAKVFSISCSDDENDDILDHVFCTTCDASMCQQDKSVEMWNKRTPQWIPVSTLPTSDNILAAVVNETESYVCEAYIMNGKFVVGEYEEEIHPTHWMYLPQPPKENE